jgi:hypothetical protein
MLPNYYALQKMAWYDSHELEQRVRQSAQGLTMPKSKKRSADECRSSSSLRLCPPLSSPTVSK